MTKFQTHCCQIQRKRLTIKGLVGWGLLVYSAILLESAVGDLEVGLVKGTKDEGDAAGGNNTKARRIYARSPLSAGGPGYVPIIPTKTVHLFLGEGIYDLNNTKDPTKFAINVNIPSYAIGIGLIMVVESLTIPQGKENGCTFHIQATQNDGKVFPRICGHVNKSDESAAPHGLLGPRTSIFHGNLTLQVYAEPGARSGRIIFTTFKKDCGWDSSSLYNSDPFSYTTCRSSNELLKKGNDVCIRTENICNGNLNCGNATGGNFFKNDEFNCSSRKSSNEKWFTRRYGNGNNPIDTVGTNNYYGSRGGGTGSVFVPIIYNRPASSNSFNTGRSFGSSSYNPSSTYYGGSSYSSGSSSGGGSKGGSGSGGGKAVGGAAGVFGSIASFFGCRKKKKPRSDEESQTREASRSRSRSRTPAAAPSRGEQPVPRTFATEALSTPLPSVHLSDERREALRQFVNESSLRRQRTMAQTHNNQRERDAQRAQRSQSVRREQVRIDLRDITTQVQDPSASQRRLTTPVPLPSYEEVSRHDGPPTYNEAIHPKNTRMPFTSEV